MHLTESAVGRRVHYKSFQGGQAYNPSLYELLFGACCAKGNMYQSIHDAEMMNSNIFFGGFNSENSNVILNNQDPECKCQCKNCLDLNKSKNNHSEVLDVKISNHNSSDR